MSRLEDALKRAEQEYQRFVAKAASDEKQLHKQRQALREQIAQIASEEEALSRLWRDMHRAPSGKAYFLMGLTNPKAHIEREVIFKPWPKGDYKNHLVPIPAFSEKYPQLAAKLESYDERLVIADETFENIMPVPAREQALKTQEWIKNKDRTIVNLNNKNIAAAENNLEINLQLVQLERNLSNRSAAFLEQSRAHEADISYLQKVLPKQRYEASIAKGTDAKLDDRAFYSFWLGSSEIFLYDGKNLIYLHTRKKNQPLEAKSVPIERIIAAENREFAERLLGLKAHSFCDEQGYVLEGSDEEKAAKVFEQVFTGVEILPNEESPGGYEIKESKQREHSAEPAQPRHWSQVYLAQKSPDKTVVGKLLGSGGSYKAYQFGSKTAVEFDMEGHATYLFSTPYFDNLRIWQKTALLESKPEGFNGRLIHKENRNDWMKNIDDFVRN